MMHITLLHHLDKPQILSEVSQPQQGTLQLAQEIPQLPQGVSQPPQGLHHRTSGEYTPMTTENGMSNTRWCFNFLYCRLITVLLQKKAS